MFQAVDLRQEIDRYIESNDMEEDEDSGEFWPIVKKVHIRVPSCHLCEAGVVLVDLPGLRDANLARSKVAKEVGVTLVLNSVLQVRS